MRTSTDPAARETTPTSASGGAGPYLLLMLPSCAVDAGLVVDRIADGCITLVASDALGDGDDVAHRLRMLVIAGALHIVVDLDRISEIRPSVAASMTDVAQCLADVGGTLELMGVQPAVATVFESLDSAHARSR